MQNSESALAPSPVPRLLVVLLVLLLLVTVLLGALVIQQQASGSPNSDPTSALVRWHTGEQVVRPPPAFVWRGTLTAAPQDPAALRIRMQGQSQQVLLLVGAAAARAESRTSMDAVPVVREQEWPSPLKPGDRITVVHCGAEVRLAANGCRVLTVPLPFESWHAIQWQGREAAPAVNQLSFQRTGSVYFSDDFMHGPDEAGEWEAKSGEWTVHSLRNPVRSANAFSYVGTGSEAQSNAGEWFWRDYQFECSAASLSGGGFGMGFCRQPNGDGYEMTWHGIDPESAWLRLTKRQDGQTRLLAQRQVPLRVHQWWRLRTSQDDGRLSVDLDGNEVLHAQDPNPFCIGQIALLSFDTDEGVIFDDVSVRPLHTRHRSTEPAAAAPENAPLRVVMAPDPLLDTSLSCKTRFSWSLPDPFRIELRAREHGRNHVAMEVHGKDGSGELRLVAVRDGETTVLDSRVFDPLPPEAELEFSVRGREAYALLNNRIACMAPDVPWRSKGRASLMVENPAAARIVAAGSRAPERLPPVGNRVETFEHERTMSNWGSAAAEWVTQNIDTGLVFQHRSDFWQDVCVRAALSELAAIADDTPWGLLLLGNSDADDTPKAQLRWEPSPSPDAPGTLRLEILDETVLERSLTSAPAALALERRNGRIQARIEGRVAASVPVPDALAGLCHVARVGNGSAEIWAEKVLAVQAEGVRSYPFRNAPSDWQIATGTWEITNRWECDPRWSFYSGVKLDGVACNWNKMRFGDNVTLEYFVGPKMDRSRGSQYEYAADLNAVVGADGTDITSGYSFLFGGYDDTGSFIMQGKRKLGANASIRIPRKGSTHRRWFYVKVRKHGPRLTYWVDNELVADVTDTEHITGDRLGLWTWKNGMMVAQVRISSDRVDPPSPPSGIAKTPACPYDP